ncbi:dUTP diphosphatase [Candidatus Saccharibacteria bacterium]|nr:dUTP diphosphatase [Candidatus Saccharibacteria bacterium]HOR23080.1 dUTP diphosphatase [Candidatus Saccharibacteria bacterium]
MMVMKIKIKKLRDNAVLPKYQTEHSAGMDLHACVDKVIRMKPGDIFSIPTGIAVAVPEGYEMQIRGRSGLALKYGIGLANGVGTIDADYRGEVCVILVNNGKKDFIVKPKDRIAQAIIGKYEKVEWSLVIELSATKRGSKGFGSTG